MAGVVVAAALVRVTFAPKRKWGPRGGVLTACAACLRNCCTSVE
jgi:hypothetical protein